tara:strand:- start:871 stop:1437 length:567 start_codon:yes stop_codon:yes gene_type:complete
MVPLIVGNNTTYPTFDSTGGTAITITDSVAAADAAYAGSFAAYDVSGKSKILFMSYQHTGASTYGVGVGIHDSTTYGALDTTGKDIYQFVTYDGGTELYKTTGSGPTWTALGVDSTIGNATTAYTNAVGMAIYADGTDVKTFIKWGSTSQWIPLQSVSDDAHTNFDQVYLKFFGQSARFITPVMCWGA